MQVWRVDIVDPRLAAEIDAGRSRVVQHFWRRCRYLGTARVFALNGAWRDGRQDVRRNAALRRNAIGSPASPSWKVTDQNRAMQHMGREHHERDPPTVNATVQAMRPKPLM